MARIPFPELKETFCAILLKEGFPEGKAFQCAAVFAENTLDGVASHGVNRFPRFIKHTRQGIIKIDVDPVKIVSCGAMEQWNGQQGIGICNALHCTDRAMELAQKHGMGCVALKNTTHWMRAGAYGWRAAEKGYLFICWTNTTANMPPWGSKTRAVGNNPLVVAAPRKNGHLVLDMALSQFSYGKLGMYRGRSEKMPYTAGYDTEGNLTDDPAEVIKTRRVLPIGMWKGSGLSMMLDLLAGIMSGGALTCEIPEEETNLSQVFIAFSVDHFGGREYMEQYTEKLVQDLKSISELGRMADISYPGENSLARRRENLEKGVPVDPVIWEKVTVLLA